LVAKAYGKVDELMSATLTLENGFGFTFECHLIELKAVWYTFCRDLGIFEWK
jgi:hypothetical protein